MNKSTESVLLVLDIGARKHAFAWVLGEHRETGSVDNTPAALRAFLTGLMHSASGVRVLMKAPGVYNAPTNAR